MKRNIVGLLAALVTAGALVAAQSTSSSSTTTQSQNQSKSRETTLTGCLTQGSSPTTFILENARMNAQDKSETGKSYELVASSSSVDLKSQLNHEVTVSGTTSKAASASSSSSMPSSSSSSYSSGSSSSPSSSAASEGSMPKLTASTISSVSDTCTAS